MTADGVVTITSLIPLVHSVIDDEVQQGIVSERIIIGLSVCSTIKCASKSPKQCFTAYSRDCVRVKITVNSETVANAVLPQCNWNQTVYHMIRILNIYSMM